MTIEAREKGVLDAREVAELLGLSASTVHNYAAAGIIPCVKVGRKRLFSRAAVEEYRARGPRPAPPPSVGIPPELLDLADALAAVLAGDEELVITVRRRRVGEVGR